VFCPPDNFILEILTQVIEVIAVSCHPDDQIAVQFRMFLGFTQCFGINYVELYMVTIEAEITPYQSRKVPVTVFIFKKLRREFLVQQSASCTKMIDP